MYYGSLYLADQSLMRPFFLPRYTQTESPAWLKQLLSLDVTDALLCNIEYRACWPESFITWVFLFLGDLLITCLYNFSTIYVVKS